MACEVHDSLLVCCSCIIDFQFVVIVECVDNCNVEVSRESLFHIGRKIVQLQCLCVGLLSIPNSCVEACRATVQVVRTVVDCEVILLAVDSELTLAYSVAVTAYKCAQEWLRAVELVVDTVVSLNYIGIVAVLVRNHDATYRATIVCDCYFVALLVLENEQCCLFAAYLFFEVGGLQL